MTEQGKPERAVRLALRLGGGLGAGLVLLGTVLGVVQRWSAWTSEDRTRVLGASGALRLAQVPAGLAHARGPAIALLGLLVLSVTPAVGVAAAAGAWLRDGPRRMALVALVVLGLLSVSAVVGALV